MIRSAPAAAPLLRGAGRTLLVLAAGAAVVSLVRAPARLGTGWSGVLQATLAIDPGWLAVSVVVWLAGLIAYGAVMTASLPGLSARRAVGLNLAGSAVANSLPLGGALSLGLTTGMMRSWGFSRAAVTVFLTLTNTWNLLGRLLVGGIGLWWFLAAGLTPLGGQVVLVLAVTTGILLLAVAVLGWSERLTRAIGRRVRPRWGARLIALRQDLLGLSRTAWPQLSLGMAANLALLGLLLSLCLRGLGSPVSIAAAMACVGVERLVTALPLTPGGAGAAELSLIACLTSIGVAPDDALAATLLYRLFTFAIEIPLGAVVSLAWRASRPRPAGAAG